MPQSEIPYLGTLKLKLELVRNQGDELRIGGFSLGVADGVAEEPLEGVQVSSVPGDFNGVANGPLHSGRSCLEGFRHLRIQNLGDGIGVPYGPPESLAGCSQRTL